MSVSNRKESFAEQREEPARSNGGRPHFGFNSPAIAIAIPNKDLSMMHGTKSVAAEMDTDTLQTEASGYTTPTSETTIRPVCQGEIDSNLGSDTELYLESVSEAEAWKKAKTHPDFETLLKIAGVQGNFELTDSGLVFRNDTISPSRPHRLNLQSGGMDKLSLFSF